MTGYVNITKELKKDERSLADLIEKLVVKAKQGDHEAFRQIVIMHEQQVISTVTGMLGDTTDARDISQLVFIRFYRSMSEFRGESDLRTYLTRIAINLSLNEIKRKKRSLLNLQNYRNDLGKNAIIDKSASPEQLEKRELVQKALQKLPEDMRSIVVLRMIEGYSVKEAAEILDLPTGTIGSRLSRAMVKLEKILKDLI